MRTLTRVAVRLIIIVFFMQTVISTINSSIDLYRQNYNQLNISGELAWIVVIGLLILFVLGYLWMKTDWLVNVLAGKVSNHELVITTFDNDLFRVAMRILGAVLLVNAGTQLAGLLGYHIVSTVSSVQNSTSGEVNVLIINGTKLIVGIWLLAGVKNLKKAIKKIDDIYNMRGPEEKTE